jgi:hypothetical protein
MRAEPGPRPAYTAPVHANGEGWVEELNRRGLAAAAVLARSLGLPGADPVVLSGRGNLLVHFAPAPVVARVATLSAWSRRDPFAWLAREVTVAGWVADQGGPVVPPSRVADPGPHLRDGFAISLWEYAAASPRRPSPAELGAALASLHLAAVGCPAELADLAPARDQITDGLEALERMATAGDWRWIDLEECCRGPAEWDLATMADQAGDGAAAALRGYADRVGRPVPGPSELAPFHDLRMLEALVWTSCMAHLYPARYLDQARQRLATFLGE